MKIQNFAVIFIVIILPISMLLSVYTGNLIDVANKQASYDAMLLNATYDAIRAYQMNTLTNSYESETNSKVRDINASINSFFNSLASGLSSSGFGREELQDYVPAIIYTLYDGYYVYGTFDNVVNFSNDEKVEYNDDANFRKEQNSLKPYIYYSCEYQGKTGNQNYDLVVNYTLDNYITVTGTYDATAGNPTEIAASGYYIDFTKLAIDIEGAKEGDTFDHKIITLYPAQENKVLITPEVLGEYATTLDYRKQSGNYRYEKINGGSPKYYNYIIYNNVKYYLDTEHVQRLDDGTLVAEPASSNEEERFNATYDSIPIFFLDRNTRTYINRNTFEELKSFVGTTDDSAMYSIDRCFKDVNAYYYYYKSYIFSSFVYDALNLIDLGKETIKDENDNDVTVISSNMTCNAPKLVGNQLIDASTNDTITSHNVIKTESYHTKYLTENGVESHIKSTYENSKIFDFNYGNDPELESSSFSHHRMDVIISSIESSLVSAIDNFRKYSGGNYEYTMPILTEEEWDRICNNMTVVTFMQGISIGNYKYFNSYAVVANTKVRDFISRESIYVQVGQDGIYHSPKCQTFNTGLEEGQQVVGYRNLDYDRKTCKMLEIDYNTGGNSEIEEKESYMYYPQSGTSAYECVVGRNENNISVDELFLGNDGLSDDNPIKGLINNEVRRAYITALAREKGNSYKSYGFLNRELEDKETLVQGEVLYTIHYFYEKYDNRGNYDEQYYNLEDKKVPITFKSVAKANTDIMSLSYNFTPLEGYKFNNKIYVLNYDIQPIPPYEPLDDSNRYLKSNQPNDIAVYFDIDEDKTKTVSCKIEYYSWDTNYARFSYVGEQTVSEQRWINLNNIMNIQVPSTSVFNENESLIYTDPEGYGSPKNIVEGSVIKAYYSSTPAYTNKKYKVVYHGNTGTGSMQESEFGFCENNNLAQNRFSKVGYKFAGWATSENGEIIYKDMASIVCVDSSGMRVEGDNSYLDLYAIWEPADYQIKYLPNGATRGTMDNSSHQYDVPSKLSKNLYEKKYKVTLDLGPGTTNLFNLNKFSVWGNQTIITYDNSSETYRMKINKNARKYSGFYYSDKNAIIKSGRTATLSYEVYSNERTTLVLKIQNSYVGQGYGTDRKDESPDGQPQFVTIEPGKWTKIYFQYKNYSDESIYDYSILSIEDNSKDGEVYIRNPRFELTNAKSTINGSTETFEWENKFLNWEWDNQVFRDEQEILNLTNNSGSIINMIAQWDTLNVELPEIYADGYTFKGWKDPSGNIIDDGDDNDDDNNLHLRDDLVLEAVWEDDSFPKVEIKVTNTTTSTISVETSAIDVGSGMTIPTQFIYYIKERGRPESEYINAGVSWGVNANEESDEDIEIDPKAEQLDNFTFTGLKQNTKYDIKVEVYSDTNGNAGVGTVKGTTIALTGNLYVKEQVWLQAYNGEGSQNITFEAQNMSSGNLYIEYRIEGTDEWITSNVATGIKHGQTVYARLTDGINYLDSISAKAWDSNKPSVELNVITEEEKNHNTILVVAYGSDYESGLGQNPKYTYYYREHKEPGQEDPFIELPATPEATMEFKDLKQNTEYDIKVKISDLAGNTAETTITQLTTYIYKVIFDGNTSTSGSMEPIIVRKDQWIQLPENLYSKTDYNFKEWRTRGSASTYINRQWFSNLSTGADVTLYAVWSKFVPGSQTISASVSCGGDMSTQWSYSGSVNTGTGTVRISGDTYGTSSHGEDTGCATHRGALQGWNGSTWVDVYNWPWNGYNGGRTFSATVSGYSAYRICVGVNGDREGDSGTARVTCTLDYSREEIIGPPN